MPGALETKEFGAAVFFDIKHAFDRVWFDGFLYKVSRYLLLRIVRILQSYLQERKFQVHLGEAKSTI